MKIKIAAICTFLLLAALFWGANQLEAGAYNGRRPFSFYDPYRKFQAYYPQLTTIRLNYTNGSFIFTPQSR